MAINEALMEIQQKLKAPKNKDSKDKYGKTRYSYRSCEDILEAVKPLLKETGCILTISDEIINIGTRFYVKATATLRKGDESISTSAMAREDQEAQLMSTAQLTGASSSYARKYALNGLLCIDDNKDADDIASEQGQPQQRPQSQAKAQAQIPVCKNEKDLVNVLSQHNVNQQSFCQWYGIGSLQEMTQDRYQHFNGNAMNVITQLGGRIA